MNRRRYKKKRIAPKKGNRFNIFVVAALAGILTLLFSIFVFYYEHSKSNRDGEMSIDTVHDGDEDQKLDSLFVPTSSKQDTSRFVERRQDSSNMYISSTIPNKSDTVYYNVWIYTKPADASIYLDGDFIGISNDTFLISLGTHNIVFYKEGYDTLCTHITVSSHSRHTYRLEENNG